VRHFSHNEFASIMYRVMAKLEVHCEACMQYLKRFITGYVKNKEWLQVEPDKVA